jgi:methyl-accepting chemotaxis protein
VRPTVAGRVMIAIAIFGLLVSVVGTVLGRQLVTDLETGVSQSLTLTSDVLVTVDDSFVVADQALETIAAGVADAELAVRAVGGSLATGQVAVDAVADLAGNEIAGAIVTIEGAMAAVERAAGTIDDALAALGSLPFGPSYDANRPLGRAIGQVTSALRGLSDELREQAQQIEQTSEGFADAADGMIGTADALAELDARLDAASALLSAYAERADEAQVLVAEQQEVLGASAGRFRVTLIAFGIAFALGQFVPLYLGWLLLQGGWPAGLQRGADVSV